MPKVTVPFRTAVFDIECTALEASYGRLLNACFKFCHEGKIHSVECKDLKDEKKALKEIHKIWDVSDIVVGWNSKMYDFRFLNARMMAYDLPVLPKRKHIDLMWLWRHYFRTRGSKLDGAAKDLKLINQKYDVPAAAWVDAAQNGPTANKSFKEIVKHCKADVLITEEVLVKMSRMGLIQTITR